MANPNIASFATLYGNTNVQAVTNSATSIVTNPSNSGQLYKIYSLSVANYTNLIAGVTLDLYRSSTAYRMAGNVNVPANSTMVFITKDNGVYLNEGDSLRITGSSVSTFEAVCSYEVIAP